MVSRKKTKCTISTTIQLDNKSMLGSAAGQDGVFIAGPGPGQEAWSPWRPGAGSTWPP